MIMIMTVVVVMMMIFLSNRGWRCWWSWSWSWWWWWYFFQMEDGADHDDAEIGIFAIINHPFAHTHTPPSAHQPTKWESNAHRIGKISVCSLDIMSGWWHTVTKLAKVFAISGNIWQLYLAIISGNIWQQLQQAGKQEMFCSLSESKCANGQMCKWVSG